MKSKNTLTSLIFLIVGCISLNAQDFLTTGTAHLKKGIYKNFEEFKNNAPSIELDYDVLRIYKDTGGILDDAETAFFKLDITKAQGKSIGRVYGFCDGKNIYINEYKPKLKPKALFMKVGFIGTYCVFEYQPIKNIDSMFRMNRSIDMNTGRIVGLSKKALKKLIEQENNLISYTKYYPGTEREMVLGNEMK